MNTLSTHRRELDPGFSFLRMALTGVRACALLASLAAIDSASTMQALGSDGAADGAADGQAMAHTREQVIEAVRRSRLNMPAFHATATVTTRRVAPAGAPGSAGSIREETVVCDPRQSARLERAVGASRQCIATDGVEHLRYAVLAGIAGQAPEVAGTVSQDAERLRLERERSMLDLLMAWPLVQEVLHSASGDEPAGGLLAWLAQPDVELVSTEVIVGGARCTLLSRTAPAGGLRVEYSLDPNAGWLPRRYEVFAGSTLVLSREVLEFEAIGSGAFLPMQAVERNIQGGITIEFAVPRDADGRPHAGVVVDTSAIAAAPAGAVLDTE